MHPLRIRPSSLSSLLAAPSRWTAAAAATIPACQQLPRRWAHQSSPSSSQSFDSRIPAPIPLVPDVNTFLRVIGRNMKQHAAKFPTWDALFTLTSPQLKELGVEPPRDRRYLLRWLKRFRDGRFGTGGDFRFVRSGVAELRVQEVTSAANPVVLHRRVVNVPPAPLPVEAEEAGETAEVGADSAAPVPHGTSADPSADADPVRVHGYKVVGARAIAGPYAVPLKANSGARVTVTEGMWEDKRGRKIDGGERRRAEVRFKRRAAERRAQREALGML